MTSPLLFFCVKAKPAVSASENRPVRVKRSSACSAIHYETIVYERLIAIVDDLLAMRDVIQKAYPHVELLQTDKKEVTCLRQLGSS